MKVLVIGSDTPAGEALCAYLEMRGTEFSALEKSSCRWKSERQAKKSVRRSDCDLILDLRLQAAVDSGIRIHDIDIERSKWLARVSRQLKVPILMLSSALVFAGRDAAAYREDDPPDGESSLAQLLRAAETAVQEHSERPVVLRMGPVFGPGGSTSLSQLLDELHEHGELALSRQRRGCPVPAEDAARVISGMIDQYGCGLEAWGIYHYCSPDMTNCYEFAEVLLAAATQYTQFEEGALSLLVAEDADAAVSHSLDCTRIRDTFAIKQQPWRASAAGYVKLYYRQQKPEDTSGGEGYGHRDASA